MSKQEQQQNGEEDQWQRQNQLQQEMPLNLSAPDKNNFHPNINPEIVEQQQVDLQHFAMNSAEDYADENGCHVDLIVADNFDINQEVIEPEQMDVEQEYPLDLSVRHAAEGELYDELIVPSRPADIKPAALEHQEQEQQPQSVSDLVVSSVVESEHENELTISKNFNINSKVVDQQYNNLDVDSEYIMNSTSSYAVKNELDNGQTSLPGHLNQMPTDRPQFIKSVVSYGDIEKSEDTVLNSTDFNINQQFIDQEQESRNEFSLPDYLNEKPTESNYKQQDRDPEFAVDKEPDDESNSKILDLTKTCNKKVVESQFVMDTTEGSVVGSAVKNDTQDELLVSAHHNIKSTMLNHQQQDRQPQFVIKSDVSYGAMKEFKNGVSIFADDNRNSDVKYKQQQQYNNQDVDPRYVKNSAPGYPVKDESYNEVSISNDVDVKPEDLNQQHLDIQQFLMNFGAGHAVQNEPQDEYLLPNVSDINSEIAAQSHLHLEQSLSNSAAGYSFQNGPQNVSSVPFICSMNSTVVDQQQPQQQPINLHSRANNESSPSSSLLLFDMVSTL